MLTQRDKNILPGGRDHETAMRALNEPDAVLQWRSTIGSGRWYDFEEADLVKPFACDLEWRIKPKTPRYRVAKFQDAERAWLGMATGDTIASQWQANQDFHEWLTDWQEVEV